MRGLLALIMVLGAGISATADSVTAVYGGESTALSNAVVDEAGLWVSPDELPMVSGFTLKPEGACLDEVCVPVKRDADSKLYRERDGQGYVNASALAGVVNQAFAHDEGKTVWSFAPVEQTQRSYVNSAVAPDFELKDRAGNVVRLSDFRGKKVLIHTWASW